MVKTKGLMIIMGLGETKGLIRIMGVGETTKGRREKKLIRGSRIGCPTKRLNRWARSSGKFYGFILRC